MGSVWSSALLSGRIFLPSAHSTLDALIVKVRIVIGLEIGKDVLQLSHPGKSLVSLPTNLDKCIPQLLNPALGQLSKSINLALLPAPHNLARIPFLDVLQFSLEIPHFHLLGLEIHLQPFNMILHLLLHPARVHQECLLLLQRRRHRLLSPLLLFPPLLPDLLAPVFAFRASNPCPFVAPIAAQFVVADPVVDPPEGHIRRPVSLVLAVKPWQRGREL